MTLSGNKKIERVRQKYPELLTNDGYHISLGNVGYFLNIYNSNINDIEILKIFGLETYKEDLNWILFNTQKERKLKLKKLNEISKE